MVDGNLKDFLRPGFFDSVVKCTKKLCVCGLGDEQIPHFKTPSLALKIGYALRKAAILERGVAPREKDKGYLDDLWYFTDAVLSTMINDDVSFVV